MKKKGKLRFSLPLNIIGAIVVLLIAFGFIISALGYYSFTETLKKEYAVNTYHIADTALSMVDGDNVDAYLAGGKRREYEETKEGLDSFCRTIGVSLIYVIQVDTSDYGHFISVFNSVNNSVDNTDYTPWEIGYRRESTNDEYRQKYRAICEEGSLYETIYRTRVTGGIHPHITTLVPVKKSDGKVAAILCIQRPIRELADTIRPYAITITAAAVLMCIITAAAVAVYLRKKVLKPIRKVSREATRFARESTKGEPLSGISRYEDLANLADSIDTMETDVVRYMDNLEKAAAEKERISTELSLAKDIQENSIPNVFPPFPDRKEFDLHAYITPARGVGGDFYNFQLIDDDHLALLIGDVSGKGIPGALFMMVTNILISERTNMGGKPSEILEFVNERLYEHNQAEMFVTIWLGILEISTGKLTAANAGHEYPALKRAEGSFELFKDKHGFVLGSMSGLKYRDYEIMLNPGDTLFVYTDGVPEAADADMQFFGSDRMVDALNACGETAPEQVLQAVKQAVDGFVKDAEQFDDLTMMCVRYNGKQ